MKKKNEWWKGVISRMEKWESNLIIKNSNLRNVYLGSKRKRRKFKKDEWNFY